MADDATQGLRHALEAERSVQAGGNLRASWEELLKDARQCTRCELYKFATQTVCGECWVTVHPSFLLRIPEEERKREEKKLFLRDLKRIKARAAELST